MSFQWIIDNAESISMDSRSVVSSTIARDGTIRSVTRGGQPWRIEAKLPDGPRWTDYRQLIAAAEALDRNTTASISFNNANLSWLFGYQGNWTGALTGTWTAGDDNFYVTGGSGSGYVFRAGDFVKLGTTGYVYKIKQDLATGGPTYPKVHRPIIESGSGTVIVGANVSMTVRCVEFPRWTIFARDQVAWNGPFVFVEEIS